MKNVLQVVTLDRFFGIEKVKEFLHKLRCDVYLERTDFDRFIDYELQEELVDALQVRPCWIHFLLLVDACLRIVQIALFDVWQRPENVLLNHLHDFVEVGDDDAQHSFLVLKHSLELSDRV